MFDYVKNYEFKDEMYMVCYANDYVCLVQYENEAQKVYQLITEKVKKFGLEFAVDKSRIMPFGTYKGTIKALNVKLIGHYRYYGI